MIHQFRVKILYKPELDLFIPDQLSRHNHKESKDLEIPGMKGKCGATQTVKKIPKCMLIQQLQQANGQENHLQWLKWYISIGWPENKDQMLQDIRTYWMFWDDMGVVDGIIMKDRCVVMPKVFRKQALDQVHLNYMRIKTLSIWHGNQIIGSI